MSKAEKTIQQRELIEERRLMKQVKKITNEGRKSLALPLVKRASFLLIQMEDLEIDIKMNGWVEMFSQSENVEPYEKLRVTATIYKDMLSKYMGAIKELNSLLKEDNITIEAPQSELSNFIKRK